MTRSTPRKLKVKFLFKGPHRSSQVSLPSPSKFYRKADVQKLFTHTNHRTCSDLYRLSNVAMSFGFAAKRSWRAFSVSALETAPKSAVAGAETRAAMAESALRQNLPRKTAAAATVVTTAQEKWDWVSVCRIPGEDFKVSCFAGLGTENSDENDDDALMGTCCGGGVVKERDKRGRARTGRWLLREGRELRNIASFMRWHHDSRVDDGVMRHPADSTAWKHFDEIHKEFSSEPHNDSNFILSTLIPGPEGPGDAIDIYLKALIKELRELWEVGVDTFDVSTRQNFKLHARIIIVNY
nr:uncharacterized protein LOC109184453 [Ipomoea batatas]